MLDDFVDNISISLGRYFSDAHVASSSDAYGARGAVTVDYLIPSPELRGEYPDDRVETTDDRVKMPENKIEVTGMPVVRQE